MRLLLRGAALALLGALLTGLAPASPASAATYQRITVVLKSTSAPAVPTRLRPGAYVFAVTGYRGMNLQILRPAADYSIRDYVADQRRHRATSVQALGGAPVRASIGVVLTPGTYWFLEPGLAVDHAARIRGVVVTGPARAGRLPTAGRVLVGVRQPAPDRLPHAIVSTPWWRLQNQDRTGPDRRVTVYRVPAGVTTRCWRSTSQHRTGGTTRGSWTTGSPACQGFRGVRPSPSVSASRQVSTCWPASPTTRARRSCCSPG